MRWFGRTWGHGRWAGDVAAHVDGELVGPEAVRFTGHLETCSACREAVAEERALKRLLGGNLAAVPVPRSFAITAAMLEKAERPSRGGVAAPALAMRLAQGALAVALIGLVSLVVIEQGTGGSQRDNTTAAPMSAESGAAAPVADSRAPEPSPVRETGSSKSAGTVVPPYSAGGVQGQSADSPIPQSTAAASEPRDSAQAEPNQGAGADDVSATPVFSAGEEGGADWLRVAEVALVVIIIAALGGYLAARRANRRSFDV